jgi:hypothetical protein
MLKISTTLKSAVTNYITFVQINTKQFHTHKIWNWKVWKWIYSCVVTDNLKEPKQTVQYVWAMVSGCGCCFHLESLKSSEVDTNWHDIWSKVTENLFYQITHLACIYILSAINWAS